MILLFKTIAMFWAIVLIGSVLLYIRLTRDRVDSEARTKLDNRSLFALTFAIALIAFSLSEFS